ncbi:radical SAM protein [Streptomyces sp. NBS 14/10]|uniref:radical SAM protein n=1 Tax=Streptomyces sp. NBS 14/10 TaxID=1945643 RepID=UPI000B7C8FDA|nr:radical SAM protein [Streptomyces sp. NBS 14/10]KAK1184381.1 radical SAM protein [Streptomyces sp. NBS 14/10]
MRSDDQLLQMPIEPFEMTERRRKNQVLNIEEYRNGALHLSSKPLALFVELTQNCNLQCPMCRFGEKYRTEWNMSEEIFDKLADELFPFAHLVDVRGWGESTMLPDFGKFVARALNHRVRLLLVTNGQINRRPVWDIMMRAHGMVTVSCDAATPELFAKLRAGGTITRLTRTVRSIVEARERYSAPRDHVRFNVVSSMDNLDDLVNIIDLAARLEVSTVVIHPLVAHFADPSHLRHDLDRTERAYADAAERGRREGVVVQLGAAPDPSLALPEMVRRPACMHPWSYAYVRYDGSVGFCDHLIGSDEYALGSLRDSSFEEIWNGEAWQQLRRAHLSGDIPDKFAPCRYTYAQRYVDFEHMVHPDRAAGLVSSATHQSITFRRDPQLVPAVPWIPAMAEGEAGQYQGEVLIPAESLVERARGTRPAT